jgi:hypothetical protein
MFQCGSLKQNALLQLDGIGTSFCTLFGSSSCSILRETVDVSVGASWIIAFAAHYKCNDILSCTILPNNRYRARYNALVHHLYHSRPSQALRNWHARPEERREDSSDPD